MFYGAEEEILGKINYLDNPFIWEILKIDSTFFPDYDPELPWVSKKKKKDRNVANHIFVYDNGVISLGWSYQEYWRATRGFSSGCSFLGVQYESIK